jgi:hypothetical protein
MEYADMFYHHADAALALLNTRSSFNHKEGGFLGQMCVACGPISEKQLNWLNVLLRKRGLPSLAQ